jgi:abortive infection bacteriophage resistance protein
MTDFVESKFCHKCGQVKPLSEFNKDKSGKDGYANHCKACEKLRAEQRRRTPKYKEYHKQYDKQYQQEEKRKQWHLEYRRNNKERMVARRAVSVAVRAGRLPRISTLKCSNCPKQARDYHHHLGYAFEHWLNVIPVCRKCHKKLHSLPA